MTLITFVAKYLYSFTPWAFMLTVYIWTHPKRELGDEGSEFFWFMVAGGLTVYSCLIWNA